MIPDSLDQYPDKKIYNVRWARWGWISEWLATSIKPLQPSILILSLPRSGSSWVGKILGSASNAIYLREPINQSYLTYIEEETLFYINPDNPLKAYKKFADRAFMGLPAFSSGIVQDSEKWRIVNRWNRRLVIKEVNPLATEYLLQQYHPRVIFLVRHPAAIALSFLERGWYQDNLNTDSWREYGEELGKIVDVAWNSLKNYHDCKIIQYEDLCADPLNQFRKLFDFTELVWDNRIKDLIYNHSSLEDNKPYGISRRSRDMINRWQSKISKNNLKNLQEGYGKFNLPWYDIN